MKPYTFKLFLLIAVLLQSSLFLSSCDTTRPDKEPDITEQPGTATPPETIHQATLTEEAARLIDLADDSDSVAAQHQYRLQAARLYLEASRTALAKQQLTIIEQQQEASRADDETGASSRDIDILLLSAEIAVAEKDVLRAKQLIDELDSSLQTTAPPQTKKSLSRQQQIAYYALKADIDFLSGKYFFVVERRTQLAAYLPDDRAKQQNNRKIWAALSNMSDSNINTRSRQASKNVSIKGWLALARVMRSGQQDISKLEDSLLDWGTRYPMHPATDSFLSELIDSYQSDAIEIRHIAVLLPMQGKLSQVIDTIKNGLLSAYYNDNSKIAKPTIDFYDTSDSDKTFKQLYDQAITDGATNIIGPFDKVVINQLLQQRELDVPVLTLNYSQNTLNHTDNLFQFGLSPEDEARQVAELAIKQNRKTAAVFYPDSEWGKRLNIAFTERYEFLGGKVLTATDYATNTNDYRRPIRRLFNLDHSAIRSRKVADTISRKTQNEPYRRQDIDMIFLAATHRAARSIMPAFKFHHASDLPVYSTSHVYTGKVNRELDRDLNGLIFCDMPWILQNRSPLASIFTKNWPQQQQLTRLFALGIDAYHLIYNLDYLQNHDYAFYAGQTGNIRLDENNRVIRQLLWARFEKGRPVQFEPEILEETRDTAAKAGSTALY